MFFLETIDESSVGGEQLTYMNDMLYDREDHKQ